jgi:5'-3' exonuclease
LRQLTRPQFFGRKIAIDASMSLYQFMIAVRYDGAHTLTDADGETTSYEQSDFFVGYFFSIFFAPFFQK